MRNLNLNAFTLTRLICSIFAVLLIAVPAAAQDAVGDAAEEAGDLLASTAAEEEAAPPRWLTSIAFGGSLTSGNSDTLGLNLAVGSEKQTEKNEFVLGAVGSYGETEGTTSTESGNLFFNYKRMFGSSYMYSNSGLFHDKIALISYRFTTSLGAGRYVIDNDRTKLGLEGGLAYIREDYEDDSTGAIPTLDAQDTFALRFAETFEQKLSETAKVWQSLEYLPEASDFGNFLLNATAGIEAALNSRMSLRFSVENRYNAEPPYESKKNDLMTVAALAIRL